MAATVKDGDPGHPVRHDNPILAVYLNGYRGHELTWAFARASDRPFVISFAAIHQYLPGLGIQYEDIAMTVCGHIPHEANHFVNFSLEHT